MLIVLFGIVLHFYGSKILREIAFPLSFLIFMVPLPEALITKISFQLKIFAAKIAAATLTNMRIPAVQDGSMIKMRHAYVIVDDVCSGLRSLISLGALGAIFAYWMKASLAKRLILFFSTIPIAIVTNVIRIIFLSTVSEIWGPQYIQGFIHELSGFIVFGLGFLLLYAIGRLLE